MTQITQILNARRGDSEVSVHERDSTSGGGRLGVLNPCHPQMIFS